MAGLRQFSKLSILSGFKSNVWNVSDRLRNTRVLSYVSKNYDEKSDPTSYFFDENIQQTLLALTRTDLKKIFCKKDVGQLEDAKFEFLTDEQLKQKLDETKKRALNLLQFPPAVKIREPKTRIFSLDPALKGYDSSKYVFTDITFGLKDNERLIAIRDLDGTLSDADWSTTDRMNQVYFPREHRHSKVPALFKDNHLEDILNRGEFVFILDLACQQFEPDDPEYQRVVSITYQFINDNNAFDKLRSTRHFGSMTFFLVWHKMVDNLLLDLIDSGYLGEAKLLIELYNTIHRVKSTKTADIEVIEEFIDNYSSKKAVLQLALQAAKDFLKEKISLEEGIKKAHGHS